ncbi:sigma-70 family RNA polymerase sigma factor [Dactylosporangium sp. NPDC051541]|uniref:sigma-70 family RNA polymerase sigma factor n=1 Tax=Dactylosporangium sp. NPDC051541 TaxID=3363977 RepID=UPI0037AC3358
MSTVDRPCLGHELIQQRPALHRYVTSLVAADPHHVEDIVQETLLRAWQDADRLGRDARPIRMWLFRTARNLVIDAWRKRRAVPAGLTAEFFADRPDGITMDETVCDRVVLTDGLRRLPPAQREILVHVHLLGRAGEDVAGGLGIPAGTVKSRTHNAIRALRSVLEQAA